MAQHVAQFRDPKTGQNILVYPKKGEPKEKAIQRVQQRHGYKPKPK
jgi:hypothetical protein